MHDDWSYKITKWFFASTLAVGLLFLFMLGGALIDVYLHPLVAIPFFVIGGIVVVAFFREMVKD